MDSLSYLQREIGLWHRSVFGEYDPNDHVKAIAQKAKEEARELYANPCAEEVADLLICALAAADRLGINPVEAIANKLEVLKERGREVQLARDKERGIVQAADMVK